MCLERSAASDSHVVGSRLVCFLVGRVRRVPPSSRSQVPELMCVRRQDVLPRTALQRGHWMWEHRARRLLEARMGGRAPGETRRTMTEASCSSDAIMSSGGNQAKRPADPTVEGEMPMVEVKRPRGRPVTRVLPMPGSVEYTEGCLGKATVTTHTANVELPKEQRAQRAHLTWEVQRAQ